MRSLVRPRASAVTSAVSAGIVLYFVTDLTGVNRVLTAVIAGLAAYLAFNAAATKLDVDAPE